MSPDKIYSVESRRKLLKALSGAITMGTGLSSVSGNALAGDESDISVGDDQVIATAPADGGPTDEEWETSFNEQDSQVYIDLLWFANPGELPLDYCAELENGNDLCVKTADVYQEGYRDCSFGQTPYLYSIDVTLEEWEAGSLRTELNMWIGIDEYECLWVGQEETAICAGDLPCNMENKYQSLLSDPKTWVDAAQTIGDWIENNEEEIIDGTVYFTKAAIYVIVLIIIVVLSGIINFFSGAWS